jgi:ATP-dependent helicase Lhr and Lhr-like helicase
VAAFQREAWRAWASGESGLIYAPTGSGKTLAALGGPMIEAIARGVQANEGLSLLWVTPLRALAADLIVQLEAPLNHVGILCRQLVAVAWASGTEKQVRSCHRQPQRS